MTPYTEDALVERPAIKIFAELWGAGNFLNAFSDEGDASLLRAHQGEVVLVERCLRPALRRLNPEVPEAGLDAVIEELTRDRSAVSPVTANEDLWKVIRDGKKIELADGRGDLVPYAVRIIDFANPASNDFLLVSQMWVSGDLHRRRPDLVGFVNGLPLVLFELKSVKCSLRDAFDDNIRDYKDTVPQLFWHNAFIVLSNGGETRLGTLTAPFEHFNEWKKAEGEDDAPSVSLATAIRGTCAPERLLDLLENFVAYDKSKSEARKVVARYFQYHGVNRAFEAVRDRRANAGRLGVFWHTQGSGKSYSMMFLARKVLHRLNGQFTFVVVTDRKELDGQIYRTFKNCGVVGKEEVQADSIADLRRLLAEDHRFVFTLIHKFGLKEGEAADVRSGRDDVVVMADEAHRTQYDGLAANMRVALPRASFLAFTGTPLMATGEEKTRAAFGDYVSKYNFADSVADGSTVRLFYENRVPRLENVNPNLEAELDRVMDFYDLSEDEEGQLGREFSAFYHLVTRDDRLDRVAEDIVAHYANRGFDGKAMVVSIDRVTAARMHGKVKEQLKRYVAKLRLALAKADDGFARGRLEAEIERLEQLDMAVVVSQGQNEIAEAGEHGVDMRAVRERMQREDLERRFKEPGDSLRIVFVCAMWMTGFDVPDLSTLYLDKPLKNHTLMQTIARANRVYPGKTCGLVVDYIGVFRNLQKALAVYAVPGAGGPEDIIGSKDDQFALLKATADEAGAFLKKAGLDLPGLLAADGLVKVGLVFSFADRLLEPERERRDFLSLAARLDAAYEAVLPDPRAFAQKGEVAAVRAVAARIREVVKGVADLFAVKEDLEDLLDRSIRTSDYEASEGARLKDLSTIDFEALARYFDETENKRTAALAAAAQLQAKAEQMVRRNRKRQELLAKLAAIMDGYNAGSCDLETFFERLKEFAAELTVEEKRAMAENLTEEELAVFDILDKESLTPDEEAEVKRVAKDLLAKLKAEKLVLEWRTRQNTLADVRVTICETLVNELPRAYSQEECDAFCARLFQHFYDSYEGENVSVYG